MKKKHGLDVPYEDTLSQKDKARIKKRVKQALTQTPKEILKTVLNSGSTPRKFLTKDEINILRLPPIQEDKRAEFINGLWEPFPPFENTFPPFTDPIKTIEDIKEYVLLDMKNEEFKMAMISQCEKIKCFFKTGKTGHAIGFAYLLGLNVMLEKFLQYNKNAYDGVRQEDGRPIGGANKLGKTKIPPKIETKIREYIQLEIEKVKLLTKRKTCSWYHDEVLDKARDELRKKYGIIVKYTTMKETFKKKSFK